MAKEKTFVEDVQRDLYDFRDEEIDFYRVDTGLTEDIVLQISEEKNDPEWMRDFRLKCLDIFNHSKMPPWGPSIDGLDLNNIVTYVKPKTGMAGKGKMFRGHQTRSAARHPRGAESLSPVSVPSGDSNSPTTQHPRRSRGTGRHLHRCRERPRPTAI